MRIMSLFSANTVENQAVEAGGAGYGHVNRDSSGRVGQNACTVNVFFVCVDFYIMFDLKCTWQENHLN